MSPASATSMPHISAYHKCHLSVLPISAAYQCQSVPPISAIYECCLSVPISNACQYPSVPSTSAPTSVPISATYQYSLSVPISAASLAHIS
ncbi:unnamed protein product, partial [Staurois parvus]